MNKPNFLTDLEEQQMIAWRRDFHAYPELAYQEIRTAQVVARELSRLGYDVKTGVAETGVIALLSQAGSRKTVMLRADMDCLPLHEENNVPYRSQTDGRMHACGHDGHTAILMTAAGKLMQTRDQIAGNIKLIFQPAEEGGNGAEKMIQQRALQAPDVDAAFGLHLWTNLPVGKIALNPGPLMAGVHSFTIQITGRGGHGAAPHQTVDAILTASQIVTALQTIISRKVDPLDSAVVSVGSIHAGHAFNVIPETAIITGTARYFKPETGDLLPQELERVVQGITSAAGARYELKYERLTPATINHPEMAQFVREIAAQVVGPNNVIFDARTMGGEDMSFFLNEVPGCFFFVGAQNADRNLTAPHHSPYFDFDENALSIGAEMLYRTAIEYLRT